MLDATDRLLIKGFQASLAFDNWAIEVVGRVVGERVLPAVERAVERGQRELLRWQAGRRR